MSSHVLTVLLQSGANDLRPHGKFLVVTPTTQRYLVGRELMLLMGMPIHRLVLDCCSENVALRNNTI